MGKSFNIPSSPKSPRRAGLNLPIAIPGSKAPLMKSKSPAFLGHIVKKQISSPVVFTRPVTSPGPAPEPDPGLEFLQGSSNFFYDFLNVTGADTDVILVGDQGLNDIGPNGLTAAPINSPRVRTIVIDEAIRNTLEDNATKCVSIQNDGATFLNQDFELFFLYQTEDGQATTSYNLIGSIRPSNNGLNLFVDTVGRIDTIFGNSTNGTFTFITTSAVFDNGANGPTLIRVRFDFTTNALTIWKNGVVQAGSFTASNISNIDPSLYDAQRDVYIGALNNDGSATSNPANLASMIRCACTPLLTDQQASDISNYLLTFE